MDARVSQCSLRRSQSCMAIPVLYQEMIQAQPRFAAVFGILDAVAGEAAVVVDDS